MSKTKKFKQFLNESADETKQQMLDAIEQIKALKSEINAYQGDAWQKLRDPAFKSKMSKLGTLQSSLVALAHGSDAVKAALRKSGVPAGKTVTTAVKGWHDKLRGYRYSTSGGAGDAISLLKPEPGDMDKIVKALNDAGINTRVVSNTIVKIVPDPELEKLCKDGKEI